jgi:site-specific recombinase XerD
VNTLTLRSYLRYLAASGLCQPGLVDAVPTVPHWRLSSLPRYITSTDLERVTSVWVGPDCRSLRNRAVILLLARLGLRARDIVTLSVSDIDWCEATLHVTGKSRRPARLPLPQQVGDALCAYIESGRPQLTIPEVFLRLRPPHGALRSSAAVSGIVDITLTLAGIEDPPARGANLLRHSAATAMLRGGATLDEVATILRHRSKDMTAHYAKIDVDELQKLAQPWPESGRC